MKARFVPILTLLLILAPAGCREKQASLLPVTSMQIGSERFDLEIAISPHDQEVGLMHRDSLDSDHGMIFISSKEQAQTFWNHDVHFPLDLVFLGADGHIVSLKHMDAYDEKVVASDTPAQYVIELNAGTVARVGVKVGDHLDLPKDVLNPQGQALSP
jgi:uncharacterized membrane protein (UPF0127 family)